MCPLLETWNFKVCGEDEASSFEQLTDPGQPRVCPHVGCRLGQMLIEVRGEAQARVLLAAISEMQRRLVQQSQGRDLLPPVESATCSGREEHGQAAFLRSLRVAWQSRWTPHIVVLLLGVLLCGLGVALEAGRANMAKLVMPLGFFAHLIRWQPLYPPAQPHLSPNAISYLRARAHGLTVEAYHASVASLRAICQSIDRTRCAIIAEAEGGELDPRLRMVLEILEAMPDDAPRFVPSRRRASRGRSRTSTWVATAVYFLACGLTSIGVEYLAALGYIGVLALAVTGFVGCYGLTVAWSAWIRPGKGLDGRQIRRRVEEQAGCGRSSRDV